MRSLGAPLAALLAISALSGCLTQGDGGNPNLRTPRLLVDATPDGRTTLYVHAAFTSEHLYDALHLLLDNTTSVDATYSYALSHKTANRSFHLEVTVTDGEDRFGYEADLRVDALQDVVRVTLWDEDGPGRAGNHTLPYRKLVEPIPREAP